MRDNTPKEHKKKGGIYQILNTISGRSYIGSTNSFCQRLRNHRSDLKLLKHPNERLLKGYLKYGPEAFVFNVLLVIEKREGEGKKEYQARLFEKEEELIKAFKADNRDVGYNLRTIAESCKGLTHSPDALTRLKGPRVKRRTKLRTARYANGIATNVAIINDDIAKEIKIMLAKGVPVPRITTYFNLPGNGVVSGITGYKNRKGTWAHVNITRKEIDEYILPDFDSQREKWHRLSLDSVKKAKYLLLKLADYPLGSMSAIDKFLGASSLTKHVKSGEVHVDVPLEQSDIDKYDNQGLRDIFGAFLTNYKKKEAENRNKSLKKGSDCPFSKLTEPKVRDIINLINNGLSSRKIAAMYGLHRDTVGRIKNGSNWKHISRN